MRELINRFDKIQTKIEELKKELEETLRDRNVVIREMTKLADRELNEL